MASYFAPIGNAVASRRPWNYFPPSQQVKIASFIDSQVRARVAAAFHELPCGGVSDSESIEGGEIQSQGFQITGVSNHGKKTCWALVLPASYEPDGLTAFEFKSDFGGAFAGIPGQVEFQTTFRVALVGPLKSPSGRPYEFPERGNCPNKCKNDALRGVLACELTGSIGVTSNFFDRWNRMARASSIVGFAQLFMPPTLSQPFIGSLYSLLDLQQTSPTQSRFTVQIRGPGENGGAVYPLYPAFELGPP